MEFAELYRTLNLATRYASRGEKRYADFLIRCARRLGASDEECADALDVDVVR